jgi:hypothetical protein
MSAGNSLKSSDIRIFPRNAPGFRAFLGLWYAVSIATGLFDLLMITSWPAMTFSINDERRAFASVTELTTIIITPNIEIN